MLLDQIEIFTGDITAQPVDAIVNPVTGSLLDRRGISQTIHDAAGPALLAELMKIGHCQPGQARVTGGFNLKARWIVHVIGPIWKTGGAGESDLLARAYRNGLLLASSPAFGIKTVAIPAGASFPVRQGARIAINETDRFLAKTLAFDRVWFVLQNDDELRDYLGAAHELLD
jgi:O-acetyl-ADP-ribose deacetylase (regulator of RNase III)